MQFNFGVKGIIRKKDKILVLKRSGNDVHKPGIWETSGGTMDENISPQEELKREINEETGLEVKVCEPFNVFTFIRDDTKEFKIGITFLCDYISGEVILSEEHSEYKWIKPEEFKQLESIESLHSEIEKYAKKYGK
ncbi:MAG: NUDIX domain-containing protein [Candidatus Moraniibacteriota bacterium]